MPPFLHLFCFVPKRNTTLTKTFATPKSFAKSLVLLSVYIIAYFPDSHNIDFTSLVNYIETTDSVTINNVGAYNYKIIPGSSIVLNVKAGEEYLLLGNACVKPSATNETYLLVTANSALVTRGVLNSNVMASGWTNLTNIKRYTATNTGSVTFSLFSGTGGSADTSVDVLNGASLTVIKIA